MSRPTAAGLVLALATAAIAHPPPRTTVREIVRIQGHRGDGPRRFTLVALGTERPFAVSDFRTLGLAEGDRPAEPALPDKPLALQGSREDLARFVAARPEQTVTILAEHRPGSADLFLIALDLCPPR